MLAIFAKITPKAKYFDDAQAAIVNILPQTRQEPGCQVFTLHEHIDQNGERHLCLYEIFDSKADYDFHHAQDYTKAVFESYKEWLAAPVDSYKMSILD